MDSPTLVFLVMILFLIHEFEEMVMIDPWVRRQQKYGTALTRKHYFVQRFKEGPPTAPVMIIGIEFIILAAVSTLTLITGWYIIMVGFLVPYIAHLVGHIFEWFQYRSYTPSLITSVITLLQCITVGYLLYLSSGAELIHLVLATIVMTVFLSAGFALLGFLEPKIKQWLHIYVYGEYQYFEQSKT